MKIADQIFIVILIIASACSQKSSKTAENKQINVTDSITAINSAKYKTDSVDDNKSAELIFVDRVLVFQGVKKGEALINNNDFFTFGEDTIFGFKSYDDCSNYCYNKMIANVFKYKNEKRLFKGMERYQLINLNHIVGGLIINFEQGTVKTIKGNYDSFNSNVHRYFNYIKGFPTDRTITGDFNGDGKKDSLMVENYELLSQKYSVDLENDGFNFIFSDKKIPKLHVISNLDYTIKNEGDLDGDGKDEIGFLYGWGTSGCRSYEVYTLKNNKWKNLIKGYEALTTTDMRAAGIVPVEKDIDHKGVILVRSAGEDVACCCGFDSYLIEKSVKVK